MLNELLRAWLAHGPAFFLFLLDFSARLHHRGSFFRLLHRFPLLPLKFLCVENVPKYTPCCFLFILPFLFLLQRTSFGLELPFLSFFVSCRCLCLNFRFHLLVSWLVCSSIGRVCTEWAGKPPAASLLGLIPRFTSSEISSVLRVLILQDFGMLGVFCARFPPREASFFIILQ